jgi:YesN/AraC family two-component response regulator
MILYVELYRFATAHALPFPAEPPQTESALKGEELETCLRSCLRQTCLTLYKAREQQRTGSYLVKRAMEYIKLHYSEDLNLEVIARDIYVSPSYLSSLFRQSIGQTYIEYLNSFRVSKAKEIMRQEPHLKNYEIATRLGYSPKYFAQIFKQLEGITLSDYRQQNLS